MTDAAREERSDAIGEAILSGRSLRSVRKEFGLSQAELDAVLEQLWPVDTAARLRMVKTDLGKLDRLLEVFYAKGLQGDPISAGIAVKIWERKHDLTGVSGVKIDLSIVPPPHVSSFDKIHGAIMRIKYGPDWQPDTNGSSNGDDSAVGVLSDLSDDKPRD